MGLKDAFFRSNLLWYNTWAKYSLPSHHPPFANIYQHKKQNSESEEGDYEAVMALRAAAPRWRELRRAFSFSTIWGAFCTTSSPSVRMSSMWQGFDM